MIRLRKLLNCSLLFTCSLWRKPSCRAFTRNFWLAHSRVHKVRAACSCNCTASQRKGRGRGMYSLTHFVVIRLFTSHTNNSGWAICLASASRIVSRSSGECLMPTVGHSFIFLPHHAKYSVKTVEGRERELCLVALVFCNFCEMEHPGRGHFSIATYASGRRAVHFFHLYRIHAPLRN